MEIFRASGARIEPPAAEHRELAELLDVGEAQDRTTGFWRALDETPPQVLRGRA